MRHESGGACFGETMRSKLMKPALELPAQGSVVAYPYLWARQRDVGETEGHKSRPVCVVLRMHDSGRAIHHLMLAPITSQPPPPERTAIEIPETERRRAGLTRFPRAWIIVDEYNYDIAERSWYLEPHAQLGAFSATFLREIAIALRSALTKSAARVDRTR